MTRHFYLSLFLSAIISVCFHNINARAAESLTFGSTIPASSQLFLQNYSEQTLQSPLKPSNIAQIDLNGDGLNEFILLPQTCTSVHTCLFRVLSESNDQIIELGQITARTLALSDHQTNGVRDIIAYDSAINDYAYNIYHWAPKRAQYILEKKQPRAVNE